MHKLTVCATTSIVHDVSKTGLSKCPNNFKVHYSYLVQLVNFIGHYKSDFQKSLGYFAIDEQLNEIKTKHRPDYVRSNAVGCSWICW